MHTFHPPIYPPVKHIHLHISVVYLEATKGSKQIHCLNPLHVPMSYAFASSSTVLTSRRAITSRTKGTPLHTCNRGEHAARRESREHTTQTTAGLRLSDCYPSRHLHPQERTQPKRGTLHLCIGVWRSRGALASYAPWNGAGSLMALLRLACHGNIRRLACVHITIPRRGRFDSNSATAWILPRRKPWQN